jgi:hypothetical protein
MKDHSGMGDIWQMRGVGFRESMLMALAIYGVARSGDACADDAAAKLQLPQAQLAAPLYMRSLLAPSFTTAPVLVEPRTFSTSEFRPRPHSFLDFDGGRTETRLTDMPTLQDNSVARQMTEFKSQDRLRLLTLWQSHASSLSIQTKRGAPSLQWSTPLMHRDSGPRGLFDHLFSISPQGAFGARNSTPRQPSVIGAAKAGELSPAVKP